MAHRARKGELHDPVTVNLHIVRAREFQDSHANSTATYAWRLPVCRSVQHDVCDASDHAHPRPDRNRNRNRNRKRVVVTVTVAVSVTVSVTVTVTATLWRSRGLLSSSAEAVLLYIHRQQ